MSVTSINVGTKRVWVSTYNPSDDLGLLYCLFLANKIQRVVKNISTEEAHSWLRQNVEGSSIILDKVEAGEKLPRQTPPGEFPVSPRHLAFELPIVRFLTSERQLQIGDVHAKSV